MVAKYIPSQKDIVYVDLNPTKGHEQQGYRPALIISNNDFNKYSNVVIALPITSNEKYFPTHHLLSTTKKIKGSILCEHVRSIDYKERNVRLIEKLTDDEYDEVMELFNACL